ncbi:hypothetical protein ABZ754_00235 [Micromonospora purpureochromogenes]|uniref:hypothetical protein n=1 Tax=Micromonospora purpureochromogenes TaxID=47872 RepID=UPI0033FDA092
MSLTRPQRPLHSRRGFPRDLRGEVERANVPSKLEAVGPIDVEDQGDDRAAVTAQVRPTW